MESIDFLAKLKHYCGDYDQISQSISSSWNIGDKFENELSLQTTIEKAGITSLSEKFELFEETFRLVEELNSEISNIKQAQSKIGALISETEKLIQPFVSEFERIDKEISESEDVTSSVKKFIKRTKFRKEEVDKLNEGKVDDVFFQIITHIICVEEECVYLLSTGGHDSCRDVMSSIRILHSTAMKRLQKWVEDECNLMKERKEQISVLLIPIESIEAIGENYKNKKKWTYNENEKEDNLCVDDSKLSEEQKWFYLSMLYLLHWEESREWALRQILGVISLFFYQSMEKSLKERVRRGSEWREGDELDSVRISGKDGVTQRDNESSDKEFEAEKGSKDKRAAKKEVKNNFGLTAEEEAIMIDDPLQAANSMFEALISSLEQSRTMLMIYTGHIKITISHSESSNFQSSSTVNKLNISSAFPNISPSISSSTSSSSSTSTSTSSISKSFSEETDKLSIHLPLLTTCPISNCLLTIVEPAVHIIQARMSVLLAAVSGSLSVGESVPLPFLLSNSSPLSSASPSSSSNLAAHSPVSLSSVTGLTSSVLLLLQLASNIHFFTQKLHKMIFGEAQQQNSVESKSENGASEKTKNRMMQDVILEGKGEFEEGEENVGLADKLKEWYFAEIPVSLFVHSSSSSPSSSSSSSSSSSTSVSNSTSINSSSVSNSSSSSVNSYQQMMSTEANESQMITDLCFNSATFHKHFNEIVAANADKYTSDVIVPLSVFCPSSFAFIGNLAHQRYSMTASATSSSSAINHIDMQENESENENLVGSASDGSDLPEPLDASGVANHSQNEHSSNVISEGSRENAEAKKKASRKSAAASVVPPRYLSALPSIFNELRAEVEESMLLFFSSLSTLGDTLSSALPAPTAMSAQASQSNSSSAASSASSSASEASTYLASTLKLLRLIFRIIGNVCSRDREIRESSVVKTDIKGVVITDYDSDADVVEELESKLDDVMLSMILMPCRLLCFNFASRFSSTNQSALFLINSISLILNTLSSLTPVKSITNDNKEEVTQKPSPIRESIRLSLSADLAVQTDSLSTLEAGNVLQDAHLWSLYSKSVNWYSKNRQKIEEEIKKAEGNSVFSQTEQESASNELKWNVNGMENILSVSGCSASEVTLGLSRFCSSVMSSSGLETKLIEQIADGDVRRVVLRKCMKIVESSYMKMYHFVCCPEMPYLNFVPDMKSRIMSPSEIIELLEYTAK